ncbi:arylamine N-acetyltransferase family protein [Amycolatopsis anabasis]|uniref:arylamine N-acetyltransferase family protein n=1 Tax=Amycolatopsis anabasis TaxID=1840409 RepID=UPI00131CDDA1|nr:arylamine N-acetyltransferase [Amycolatopsis anabasis]
MDPDAYLARIGASRPERADARALRDLHLRHLDAVPFENLSVHLGEPIELDEPRLYDKIVRRGRGGFCYELNGAFAWLLTELGFEVALLSARVFTPDGEPGPPFDHLTLRVDLDEPWLADVGFGRFARFPLRLDAVGPQRDPEGEFLVLDTPDGDLEVRHDGRPVYLVETRPRRLRDFAPTCWWQATSPDSHFTRSLTCSLPTPQGRITLSGDRLIETCGDEREERTLTSDEEILDVYRISFGMRLDRVPALRQVPGRP